MHFLQTSALIAVHFEMHTSNMMRIPNLSLVSSFVTTINTFNKFLSIYHTSILIIVTSCNIICYYFIFETQNIYNIEIWKILVTSFVTIVNIFHIFFSIYHSSMFITITFSSYNKICYYFF